MRTNRSYEDEPLRRGQQSQHRRICCFDLEVRSGMAGINNRSANWCSFSLLIGGPVPVMLFRVKTHFEAFRCGENVTFCAKKPLFYAARASLSIAGFGPHRPGTGPTVASSDWYSACFILRPRLGHAGRFSAPEVATCTNSCSKKVFEKRQDCGYTLPATTWLMWG